ncbi:MAG: hypothetical protein IT237_11425 [Bacteroidia bacterium]|nr:hypothetical protein [Bacteroidia bacterium]
MKQVVFIVLVINTFILKSQTQIKIVKEDNQFLFFQSGKKNDTIIKDKSDLFFLQLPDSSKQNITCYIFNGQLVKTKYDKLYQLRYIPGMKYAHCYIDTLFNTTFEGNCSISKTIQINFLNKKTHTYLLKNSYTYQ